MSMPFLTAALPGIGGQIRTIPEDFQVEERPLYLPCGEGEHLYVKIRKRLLSTPDLVLRLSSFLGVKAQAIGVAGLKDARAVTTQMVSLLGVAPERLDQLKLDEQLLSVEVLGRHRNRLPGHHAGNHFRLALPGCRHARPRDGAPCHRHADEGVCLNYFGPQRQGRSGQNYQIGAELLVSRSSKQAKSLQAHVVPQRLSIAFL